jgi:hypothetical protein
MDRVTLFVSIRPDQHETIRTIAFREKRSIADITREALDMLIKAKRKRRKKR